MTCNNHAQRLRGSAPDKFAIPATLLHPQGVAQRVATLLAGSESMKWTPDKPVRSLEGACSPHIEDLTLYLKVRGREESA